MQAILKEIRTVIDNLPDEQKEELFENIKKFLKDENFEAALKYDFYTNSLYTMLIFNIKKYKYIRKYFEKTLL